MMMLVQAWSFLVALYKRLARIVAEEAKQRGSKLKRKPEKMNCVGLIG
jgi:hypothetical protein